MTVTRSQDGYREPSPTRRTEVTASTDEASFRPPLLLAPPRSRTSELQHRLSLSLFRLFSFLGLEQTMVNYVVRLSLFLFKIATLARPCFPYVPSPQVSIPLVLVAAIDFGLPGPVSSSSMVRRASVRRSAIGGPGTSTVLLVLHLAVLWTASRWGALCVPAPRDVWADW